MRAVIRCVQLVGFERLYDTRSHKGFDADCLGTFSFNQDLPSIAITGPIESGDSGGPIVDPDNFLISVVSSSCESLSVGAQPIIWISLPPFIRDRITEAESECS